MNALIERLDLYLKNNYPQVFTTFNTGATQMYLDYLESIIGLKMPEDFKSFYSHHNGQSEYMSLFNGDSLLDIKNIIREWKAWEEITPKMEEDSLKEYGVIIESSPDLGVKSNWWNKAWIPITWNGCGDSYCIDLDPTEDGNLGQIIRMCHDDASRELVATSFNDWIEKYVEDLEKDNYEFSDSIGVIGLWEKGSFD